MKAFIRKILAMEQLPEYLQEKLSFGLYNVLLRNRLTELDILDRKYAKNKSDFYQSAAQLRKVHRFILETASNVHNNQ